MSKESVEITSLGIKKVLEKYKPERAITEYIWNGFDAKATIINVDFEIDSIELDTFSKITISDNGEGIIYEDLADRFRKFYESNKINTNTSDLTKGKNGFGRFTFFKFSRFAKWKTTYSKNDAKLYSYQITINSDNLKEYNPSEPKSENKLQSGTVVEFNDVSSEISSKFIEDTLKPYLRSEFAWYLELREEHKLFVNGEELDYSSIIAEHDSFPITITDKNDVVKFECKYIRWTNKQNDEYSKFYFVDKNLELKKTRTTSLNKKGDSFWHSLIVISAFFNNIIIEDEEAEEDIPLALFDINKEKRILKTLTSKLNEYLKDKRRPFLKVQASKLVDSYEKEKVFPKFGNELWDVARKEGLENLVKELYEVDPAVFMKLNKEQKKIFLELLNLVMDSSETESLFKIFDAVIELDTNDRKTFAKILETTKLKQVITTINLIKDRLIILENLKKLVFNHELKANERDHLQKYIEKHYWIFGEEYRMVCAEEVKFEEALRRYIYLLRGVNEKTFIEHPDKYKEMDLFLCGADFRDGKPHNVVIEVKNPSTIKKLKSEQMTQIEEYMDVILKQDCFNDMNEEWTFVLIGQDYDDIVSRRIQNKNTGLVQKGDNYSLYIKKWSEITNEVERRLKYLLEKLKIERNTLSQNITLKEIIELESTNNN